MNCRQNTPHKSSIAVWLLLVMILLLALFLRLVGTWSPEIKDYHPDEWVIAKPAMSLANHGRVGLKEHYKWSACGVIYPLGYTLYALKGWFGPYTFNNLLFLQKVISAIAATAAVFILFLLARKLFQTKTALIAAALLAVAALPATQGHYGTITSIVSLVILSVVLLCYDLFDVDENQDNRRLKTGKCCLLGLLCGWGIAAKWTVLLAAIPISGAFILSLWFNRPIGKWGEFAKINLKRIALISALTVVSFLAAFPDFQLVPEKVISGFKYEMKHNQIGHKGTVLIESKAWSQKTLRTGKLLAKAGSIYGLAAGIIATIFCLCRPTRPRVFLLWTMLTWLAILFRNFLTTGRHHLVPFIMMLMLIAVLLGTGTQYRRRWLRVVCWAVFAFLVISGTLHTCINLSPFWKPNAQIQCSNWIMSNIPPGSGITGVAGEHRYLKVAALKKYPLQAAAGKDQYIITLNKTLERFKKHPPSRKIVPSEWFPKKPPARSTLLLYAEMNSGGGPNLSLVKKFYAKPSFLGLDLSLFGQSPNVETTSANHGVTLFRLNKPNEPR